MINLADVDLREGQDRVAEYEEGLLAVPAIPGAGKTFTLAYLTAELIARDDLVLPGKVLIVTYMNSAVSNFRSRIGSFLKQKGLPQNKGYEVKTLHSLAMNILKERPDQLLINQEFQVLDQRKKGELIEDLTNQWLDNNKSQLRNLIEINQQRGLDHNIRANFCGFVNRMIAHLKMKRVSTAQISSLKEELDHNSYLNLACDVFIEYSMRLHDNAWLDFNDLIVNALTLLEEDQELLARLRKKWTYIFEDEAQDSNPIQEEILTLLTGDGGNLIRVGDSNQAIMGTFTSADPDNFRSFCRRLKESDSQNARKIDILSASRSTEQIIDLANKLVEWSCKEHPQVECKTALERQLIKPVAGENPETDRYTIASHVFKSFEDEARRIAKFATEHADQNPDNTIAIIAPTNKIKSSFAQELEKLGAAYEEVGHISNSHKNTISVLQKVVRYLVKPHKLERLQRLMEDVFLVDFTASELQVIKQVFQEKSIGELIYPLGEELSVIDFPDELIGNPKLYTAFTQALDQIKLWLDASLEFPPDKLVLFLAEQLELAEDNLALAQGIALIIREQLTENPEWKLSDVAEQIYSLESSFENVASKLRQVNGFEPKPGVITVLTAHKSKGLEWDTVYLTYLTSSKFPATVNDWFRSDMNKHLPKDKRNLVAVGKAELEMLISSEKEDDISPLEQARIDLISERLRLLYVAITRAKQNLFLSCSQKGYLKPSNYFEMLAQFIIEERKNYEQS
ncbi:ATP-dependent helicase [Natroniella acetigena]|uniref:ATP-dependent helicase n=1 Tax=Natroniella acetigena TaxID=52004 RepID=UPI00200AAFF9|nr:ATP-dependent helicase [Natroniella acetigena]MCK8827363.1 ATP-dependent helicase [Natroniella acetigena]